MLCCDGNARSHPHFSGVLGPLRPKLDGFARVFLQAGLLRSAPAPETVIVDEPDDLPRLARLHHELGLPPEALDIILAMRRRLERLQTTLAYETARARQLEEFLYGAGPVEEL